MHRKRQILKYLAIITILISSFTGCSSQQNTVTSDNSLVAVRLLDDDAFVQSAKALVYPQNYRKNVSIDLIEQFKEQGYLVYRTPINCLTMFNTVESQHTPELRLDNKLLPFYGSTDQLYRSGEGWAFAEEQSAIPGNEIEANREYKYTVHLPTGLETVLFYFDESIEKSGLTIENSNRIIARAKDADNNKLAINPGILPPGESVLILHSRNIADNTSLRSIRIGSDRSIIVKLKKVEELHNQSALLSFNRLHRFQRQLIEFVQGSKGFFRTELFPLDENLVKAKWKGENQNVTVSRRAFLILPSQQLSYRLTLPESNSRLTYSLGYDVGTQAPLANLAVSIQETGSSSVNKLRVEELHDLSRMFWHERRIDLSAFAGKEVDLTFHYRFDGVPEEFVYLAIGEPTIVPQRSEPLHKQKNIILVSLDTMRADRLSISGHGRKTTPFLDSLAENSFWAKNYYSTGSWTLPGHKTIFSGLHHFYLNYLAGRPHRRNPIPSGIPLITSYLKKAGYQTFAVIDKGFVSSEWGFDLDFDAYYEYVDGFGIPVIIDGLERVYKQMNVKEAETWIQSNKSNQPFFMFVHTFGPHISYSSLGYEHLWREQNSKGEFPPDIRIETELESTPEMINHVNLVYDRNMRRVDDDFRDFFNHLQEYGLLENTIVIITSDHGEMLGEHGMIAEHGMLWEDVVKIPLVIHGTNIPDSFRSKRFSSMMLAPMILEMAGIETPEYLAGSSMQASTEEDETFLTTFFIDRRYLAAFYKSKYKLLLLETEKLLFDLDNDQAEINPLDQHTEEFKSIAAGMKSEALIRLSEELPGWGLYLPNLKNKKIRVRLENLSHNDIYHEQRMMCTLDNTNVVINRNMAKTDGTSLLYCFESKKEGEINLVIEEWDNQSNTWKQFDEEIIFQGDSAVLSSNMVLLPDNYGKAEIEKLIEASQHSNILWYSSRPFRSDGQINEVSLSREDIENLKNLGYLQ